MEYIQKAMQLKVELDALRPINKDQEARIMQKFRLDWNYHSNHLEGNSLTFGETKALLLHGITAQGKPLKDHIEITGHNEAINWIIDVVKDDYPLNESFIRQLHRLLLKESYEVPAITSDGQPTKTLVEVGKYKSLPDHVQTVTGEIFYFATPEETPAKMEELINWFRSKKSDAETSPILLSAEFHYKFIRIHPFDDRNGRTARILMNFILMQYGYPPVIIKTEDKTNYFAALQQGDAGLIEQFVEYIAKNLVRSLEIMIAGAKGEDIEEPDDIDKEIALLEHKLKGIGKKSEIVKSIEAILKVYDESINRLWHKLLQKCSKFDDFYADKRVSVLVDGSGRIDSENRIIKANRENLSDFTNEVILEIKHIAFNSKATDKFDYTIRLIFVFDILHYKICFINIMRDKEVVEEKTYDEQLIDAEIDRIVNEVIRQHIKHIESVTNQPSSQGN